LSRLRNPASARNCLLLDDRKRPVVGRVAKLADAGQHTVSIVNPKPIE
jgi:hypothetical protein